MNTTLSINLGQSNETDGSTVVVSFTNVSSEEYTTIKKTLKKEFGIEF